VRSAIKLISLLLKMTFLNIEREIEED
jgi:hypothetical protein